MRFRLEPNSGTPLGQQIMRQVRLAIAAGRLGPGYQLPSARDLAAELGVNFHTVRKAYADLEAEQVLRFERGKGTFVADRVARLDAATLRQLVRQHLERLAADLAGAGVSADEIEALVMGEIRALFPAGSKGRNASSRTSFPSEQES